MQTTPLSTMVSSGYTGETLEGRPHGKGLLKFADGSFYEGAFSMGGANGEGVYSDAIIGGTYKGTFKNGYLTGEGVATDSVGWHYEGGFLAGLFHGEGLLEIEFKKVKYLVEGRFFLGKLNGWLKLVDWKNPIKEQFLINGSPLRNENRELFEIIKFRGMTSGGDYRLGEGVMEANGVRYRLPSSDGKVVITEISQFAYEGPAKDGRPHGVGEYYDFEMHTIYKGEFVEGDKQGYGEYTDGISIYEGYFENNEIALGRGSSGMTIEGAVVDGMPEGPCVIRFTTGVVLEGVYVNGSALSLTLYFRNMVHPVKDPKARIFYESPSLMIHSTGEVFEGTIVKGRLQGPGTHHALNHDTRTGNFKNGNLHGLGIWATQFGTYRGEFYDGKLGYPFDISQEISKVTESSTTQKLL